MKKKIKNKFFFTEATQEEIVSVYGARENNLKNIDLSFPRNRLVVITGISGSGKSSLAFDTIYAEGQRRYMESFSAYARSFIGNMERPDVDKIEGLSPVISIEQKTTSHNLRSTVGTLTEIYDFIRLLFARAGEAYSYVTGEKMVRQTEDQIRDLILSEYEGEKMVLLAPVVKGRKGHYRELFVQIRKMGFSKVRVDGKIVEISARMQLDRYKIHDIEIVIDRFIVRKKNQKHLVRSLKTAMQKGKGIMMALFPDKTNVDGKILVRYFSKFLMCPTSGIAYDEPAPNAFSFNSPYGACPQCNGLGTIEEITEEAIVPNPKLSIKNGAIAPLGEYRDIWIFKKIKSILDCYKCSLITPIEKIPRKVLDKILYGTNGKILMAPAEYAGVSCPTQYQGIIHFLEEQKQFGTKKMRNWVSDFTNTTKCPLCQGNRLKKESLYFKIADKNIAELVKLDINHLCTWFNNLEKKLSGRQKQIGSEILKEISKRLGFLKDVGLDYLILDRPLKTLSGGEAQRIRLATQIGTQLVGVLYILDEPSIGLHQRDNTKLIKALQNLRDLGNSVIVVEHDKDMMLQSDYIMDIGPGAGLHGGTVVAAGKPKQFIKQKTATAHFLSGKAQIQVPAIRRKGSGKYIVLEGAKGHNLKDITVPFPLGRMICVTGVSGSGKSTLVHDTLFPLLSKYSYRSRKTALSYKKISGIEYIDKVIEVDQSPIGRTPRSNPATYTGMFAEIRSIFSDLPESKIRGYKPGRFSFNVKSGRCEVCEGNGKKLIEMDFLPDVYVDCQTCRGRRYNSETLEVCFKSKSIADVLELTVSEAVRFFENHPKILRKVKALDEVGLGYITLGQHATTLSGGEAQRVKLATDLAKKDTGKTFYILDEPTTGLHFQDIQHLLNVLNKLVNKGNTVLVIEHNMDVIKVADHIIDVGPEGGHSGGKIVCQGTPETVAKHTESHTAAFLKRELLAHEPQANTL